MKCLMCTKEASNWSKYCSKLHCKMSMQMYSGETVAEFLKRKVAYLKKKSESRGTIKAKPNAKLK